MLHQAITEVRLHPGRFLSTLLAIAISVAFLAGSAVLVETEGAAQALTGNRALTRADVVVGGFTGDRGQLALVDGVAEIEGVVHYSLLLTGSSGSAEAVVVSNVLGDGLRWTDLVSGAWPEKPDELVLTSATAKVLGITLGEEISTPAGDQHFRLVGLTDEPGGLLTRAGYASAAFFASQGAVADTWVIRTTAGSSAETVATAVAAQVARIEPQASVLTGDRAREDAVKAVTGDFAAFTYLLWAFAGVALVVGMITIANTFTITLAQRRRQIGLLRAVGASGAQVRVRFLAEAVVLGVLGALLGIGVGIALAAAAAAWTGSLFWGLRLPFGQLGTAFSLGLVTAVVAAWVPIVKGTRAAPLEALAPASDRAEARRAGVVRAVVCAVIGLAGAATVVLAFRLGTYAFPVAVLAGLLIAVAVLFAAPLFVPPLLKVTGLLIRPFGSTASLAADNAERNPRRTAATASALMLAVGLMVTLQVATASIRATGLDQLDRDYPVDLSATWYDDDGALAAIPEQVQRELSSAHGIGTTGTLAAAGVELLADGDTTAMIGLAYDGTIAGVSGVEGAPGADEAWVSEYRAERLPATVEVSGERGRRQLKVVASALADYESVLVSPQTLADLGDPVEHAMMWLSVPDRTAAVSVMAELSRIVVAPAVLNGSIAQAAMYEQVLQVLLTITTSLLAVSVLIALVGVSNTLGLSVLERTRESALLRALGLQARSLRLMLTIEAIEVTLVGIGVGVVAGGFFGWLAVSAMTTSAALGDPIFAVDLPRTAAMVGIALVAAALASVLPGRRAAKAAPTEALAEI